MNPLILIILGAVVLICAIAVIIVSLQRNTRGDEDDALQARLAEFIQRGDVASLEEIELSQPFSERVIIPILRKLGIKTDQWKTKKNDSLEQDIPDSKKGFNISVSSPRLLSKRFEAVFLIQLYLPKEYPKVRDNIKTEFQDQETSQHINKSSLKLGENIRIKLFHPDFDFSGVVTKVIDGPLNKIIFLGKPKENCQPGLRKILVSISSAKTEKELESFTFTVQVVDFAFDHVSRPLLSRISAVVLGVGSLMMFMLTFLEQIDKTVGVTSGTVAGILASVVYANFYDLFQRIRPNTP